MQQVPSPGEHHYGADVELMGFISMPPDMTDPPCGTMNSKTHVVELGMPVFDCQMRVVMATILPLPSDFAYFHWANGDLVSNLAP